MKFGRNTMLSVISRMVTKLRITVRVNKGNYSYYCSEWT